MARVTPFQQNAKPVLEAANEMRKRKRKFRKQQRAQRKASTVPMGGVFGDIQLTEGLSGKTLAEHTFDKPGTISHPVLRCDAVRGEVFCAILVNGSQLHQFTVKSGENKIAWNNHDISVDDKVAVVVHAADEAYLEGCSLCFFFQEKTG